jgi:hypothetical protein
LGDQNLDSKYGYKIQSYKRGDTVLANQWKDEILTTRWRDKIFTDM